MRVVALGQASYASTRSVRPQSLAVRARHLSNTSASTSGRAAHHVTRTGSTRDVRARVAYASLSSVDMDIGEKYLLANGMVDYYALLGVDDDSSFEEVKKAYRTLAKTCHPDFLGDEGHDICILLNEAYAVLCDQGSRELYNQRLEQALKDEEDDYTGQPLSKWMPDVNPAMSKHKDPAESRAVFVDEFSCIGCKQCVWHACATFRIEPEHGRSRAFAQWLDDEEHLQGAIDSCPVSCIHWVDKGQLPMLEYVMQRRLTTRTNVGVMMAGQGATADVWAATEQYAKERKRRAEAQALAQRKTYSKAQYEARKAATSALRKKTMGNGLFAKLTEAMDDWVAQMNATVSGIPEDLITVGKRKRVVRWDEAAAAAREATGRDYYLVPPERALVPVSISARD